MLLTEITFNCDFIALSFSNDIANISFFKGLVHSNSSIKSNLVISPEDKTLLDYKLEGT